MTTLLSIDWDFFADMSGENDPKLIYMYDWGHSESHNSALLNILWVSRAAGFTHYGLELPTTSGEEDSFWNRFTFSPNCEFYLAESHMNAAKPEVYSNVTKVINFDAHHDCGYSGENNVAESMRVSCEDWMLLYDMIGADTEVVYPRWRSYALDAEPKPPIDVDRVVDDGEPISETIDKVFICRSGSWVPPWLDTKFKEFVERCPVPDPIVLGDLQLVRDWDYQQVEQGNEIKKQLLEMHEASKEK